MASRFPVAFSPALPLSSFFVGGAPAHSTSAFTPAAARTHLPPPPSPAVIRAHLDTGSITPDDLDLSTISSTPGTSDGADSDADVDDIDDTVVPDTDFLERKRRIDTLSAFAPDAVIPVPPQPTVVEVELSPGRTLRLETGRMARQAAGAVAAKIGDTMVFCTACVESTCSPTVDFLPLRVDYAEKFSATGKTSGSYVKREGRPSEREVLVSRLIDRPLRPMFASGFFNEVQVLANVFSYDGSFPADALAICGASAALHVSHIPLVSPVAGVRLAYARKTDGADGYDYIVEPTTEEIRKRDVKAELVIAGSEEGILMIEGSCEFLTTDTIMAGIEVAYQSIIKICHGIDLLRERTGCKPNIDLELRTVPPALFTRLSKLAEELDLDGALAVIGKKDRDRHVGRVREAVFGQLSDAAEFGESELDDEAKRTVLNLAWKELVSERMRCKIIDSGIRPDGRDVYTVRPISIDVAPLPNTHGSALFTRGETQTLAVATLGGDDMAQRYETLEGEDAARFYLQYSFPPFSVGEVGRLGPPGRREIGHGKLAERALVAAIPTEEEFPYVLRVESNILESNGSSSMASVCGGCLALLDAGVPMKCSVGGVAMGLVIDKRPHATADNRDDHTVILTDILGLEDALGSCDAKFAGSRTGWSALQLDVKLRGISLTLLTRLLAQAADGLRQVLDAMDGVMPRPSPVLPRSVPRVETVRIPPKRIGELIGPGGKNIRTIIERCGGEDVMKISVDNDGKVGITSCDPEMLARASSIVGAYNTSLNVGTVVQGRVTKILPFGAYLEIADGREGWMHISEMDTKRTEKVEDLFAVGDSVQCKVSDISRGQVRLSRKAILKDSNLQQQHAASNGVASANSIPHNNSPSKDRHKQQPLPSTSASSSPPSSPTSSASSSSSSPSSSPSPTRPPKQSN